MDIFFSNSSLTKLEAVDLRLKKIDVFGRGRRKAPAEVFS